MIRLALALLLFAAGQSGAATQMGSSAEWTAAAGPEGAQLVANCTDSDSSPEWHSSPSHATSTIESAWKWRSVHAVAASTPRPRVAVPVPTPGASSHARTPAAPEHLRHTPLLI